MTVAFRKRLDCVADTIFIAIYFNKLMNYRTRIIASTTKTDESCKKTFFDKYNYNGNKQHYL